MSRRTRSELRELMIEAGCELVRRRGLAFDPPSLTYANVFSHIEQTRGFRLHRSQVHGRIWESQDHYRIDVAIMTIRHAEAGSAEVDELVTALSQRLRPTTVLELVEGWVAASTGASRDGADADLRFDLLVAAQALSTSGTAPEIAAAAATNLTERMTRNEQRYGAVADKLGLQVDPQYGLDPEDAYRLLARNSSALIEGARLMEPIDDVLGLPFEITDTEGDTQMQDIATFGLCLLVEQVFGINSDTILPASTTVDD